MIVLFTDFGRRAPYTAQMVAVLAREAAGVPVVDLLADAPSRDPRAAAYLLAAYTTEFPPGTVFLCVVDPGVGTDRLPCVVRVDGRWFVGPGNGLTEPVIRRAQVEVACWRIDWVPPRLTATFHGRDLFAPVAARLARGEAPPGATISEELVRRRDWPDDLASVVYVDDYGNAMTGLRADAVDTTASIRVAGRRVPYASTYAAVSPGEPFWYANANGLVEIAVNMGSAARSLGISVGTAVDVGPANARCSDARSGV